jgi:hypothetical protein
MRGGHNFDDLTGRRFGRLVVLHREKNEETHLTYWRVRCDCGTEFVVSRSNLVSGGTRSCGCLRRELLEGRAKK